MRRTKKLISNDLRCEIETWLPFSFSNEVIGKYDEAALMGTELLVSTKRGFLHFVGGEIRRLLDGQFFGISAHERSWFFFQRVSRWSGRIVQFGFEDHRAARPTQVIKRLSPGCHQIDFLGTDLYVTDTYNNRLFVYSMVGGIPKKRVEYYPGGKLANGRESSNYAHMNSIWRSGSDIYVLFHNETRKTGQNSEIVRLDANHEIAERISTNASNAHNVVRVNDDFLYCDSLNGKLIHGDSVVYESEYFTRGLAVTPDLVLLGASEYGARETRDTLAGGVTVLDRGFNFRHFIPTPGMVQDIRAVNPVDYALSNLTPEPCHSETDRLKELSS
ncbi:MAG: hypothetical protein P1U77_25085 [Rubripirellula sp.]|nr:hypothetical protein [Rubripirellula sp.]